MAWWRKKNTKIFGVDVELAIKRSHLMNGIPLVLTRCVDTIEKEALTLEGIYRRVGDLGHVERIMKQYDTGKDPDIVQVDPFVLTSLLKKYFTLLPEPITSFELYFDFITAKKSKNREDKVKGVRELVMKLPEKNKLVLYFLLQHLVRVSKHSDQNKMSVQSLSIVFGPTLFRSTDNSSTRLFADAGHLGGCVEIMISNFDQVFDFMMPNQQMSVRQDEEIIKLMGPTSPSAATMRTSLPKESRIDKRATTYMNAKADNNIIKLNRDQRRIMSTRVGLNFVELSAQFYKEDQGNSKHVANISIPMPTSLNNYTQHNNTIQSPPKDAKLTNQFRARRMTKIMQLHQTNQLHAKLNQFDADANHSEELILLPRGDAPLPESPSTPPLSNLVNHPEDNKDGKASIPEDVEPHADVNQVLSDTVNLALLELTSLCETSFNDAWLTQVVVFDQWKKDPVLITSPQPETAAEQDSSEFNVFDARMSVKMIINQNIEQVDQESFDRELHSIRIDCDHPLQGVTARINLQKMRMGILTDNDVESVEGASPQDLKTERNLLKGELSRFDRYYQRERKCAVPKVVKLELKPLYDRYKKIVSSLHNVIKNEQPPSSSGVVVPINIVRVEKSLSGVVSPITPTYINYKVKPEHEEEYHRAKKRKHELKKKLHQYQDDFLKKNGRKINSKLDRKPIEKELEEYKKLKKVLSEMDSYARV
ncbi:gacJJ [Acrasis kona]|uniref:GacJJ n=1 Tax=Acrasis kona TaxID=1008807 RepID=A0AAW2YRL2_9EUKA